MYKRKKEIKALDLLKEINEFRKSNKSDIYDTKTLNIDDPKRIYNTKTIKTCITSYNDSLNKEIKKKKNIGKLDLCSHRNKDIFIELDSEQFDSNNNSKESFNYRKNKCSKLLINKITPLLSEHYLTQNNINPYYSIKTYNNYNIRKPFNNNNERKNKKEKLKIENEIIPYKINKNKKSNNISFNSSNDKIKYPFVISLKSKNNNHIQKNSNLSNYFNDEINDYFDSFTENSNYFDENEDNNNRNYFNYTYNNINKEKNSFEKNQKKTDYKKLYLMKKKQFDDLLKEYNDMHNKLNKSKNNYMINNFKKLNRNKINNKIKKEFNIIKENQFEIIKTLKNKINLIPININQIKLYEENNSNNLIKNKDNFVINKLKNFKILSKTKTTKSEHNKIDNNINIIIPETKTKNLNEDNKKEKLSFSDILDEINTNNLTKLKNVSINNKHNKKEKREIVEYNIDRILDQNKNNKNQQNYYPKEEFNFLKEEIRNLPDLSYIRNKLKISIIKMNKINENELNNI